MIRTSWAVLCRVLLALACLLFFAGIVALCLRYQHLALLVAFVIAWKRLRRWRPGGWIHGVARLSGWQDLLGHRLLEDDGLILGDTGYLDRPTRRMAIRRLFTAPLGQSVLAVRLFLAAVWGPRWADRGVIRVKNFVHLATFASTGGGKGVGVVIPNLLSYSGSMVISDTKTENFHASAKHRRRKFGHRIVRLEPFGKDSDCFNPLDAIDATAPDFIDQCRDLAAALVVRTGKESEAHWNDSAERVLQAMIAFVCACEPGADLRNLQTVRQILSSRERYNSAVQVMQIAGDVAGGMLQRLGHSLSWLQDRELASVLSTVQRHTAFLDSPPIAANTARSSFDPRELRGKMTIYLCLPPERLKSLAGLQRMWISSILRTIIRGADERHKVLFLLDEIGNMGHLQIVEDAVTLMRGMGIRLWFIFQSLGQVKDCFGDHANTFLENIGTQQYFSIRSYETAEALSKRIGDATIESQSDQDGTSDTRSAGSTPGSGSSGSTSTSRSTTTNEIARKLLMPGEILTMPPDLALIFHENMNVILARLIKYYNAPEFRGGRSGRSRGLGLGGGLAAAAPLLLAFGLPVAGVHLMTALGRQRQALSRPRAAYGRPGSAGHTPLPYGGTFVPQRRSSNPHGLPSRSGYLIPIR